jgi:hypothetical protein
VIKNLVRLLRAVGCAIWGFISLIRDGESDLRETYPEHYQPTGEQVAAQGSMFASMSGVGHP